MADLSIIMPTLNAGEGLRRSLPPLAALNALNLVHEVIFADGGSTDETCDIAEAAGVRVVAAERGRGQQLAEAASERGSLYTSHSGVRGVPTSYSGVAEAARCAKPAMPPSA